MDRQETRQLNKIDSLFLWDALASETVAQEVIAGGWEVQVAV